MKAAAREGSWLPAPGYVFVNDSPSDLTVREMTVAETVKEVRAQPTREALNGILRRMHRMNADMPASDLPAAILRSFGGTRFGSSVDPRLRDWLRLTVVAADRAYRVSGRRDGHLGAIDDDRNESLAVSGGVSLVEELAKTPATRWSRASIGGFVLGALFEIGKAELLKSHFEDAYAREQAFADGKLFHAWHGWPVLLAELCHEYGWQFPRL